MSGNEQVKDVGPAKGTRRKVVVTEHLEGFILSLIYSVMEVLKLFP